MQVKVFNYNNSKMAIIYLEENEINSNKINEEIRTIRREFNNKIAICISGYNKFDKTIELFVKNRNK